MNGYRFKPLKTLFTNYADENTRVDKRDAGVTKKLIRDELQRRLRSSLQMLDAAGSQSEVEQIYKQFIEH